MSETTETKIETPEGKDLLEFTLSLTLKNGVEVPAEVYIVYPEGNGLHAVKGLEQLVSENMDSLYMELVHRQDAATIQTMLARGYVMLDDEG